MSFNQINTEYELIIESLKTILLNNDWWEYQREQFNNFIDSDYDNSEESKNTFENSMYWLNEYKFLKKKLSNDLVVIIRMILNWENSLSMNNSSEN